MLINKYLPDFHFSETHTIQVPAAADKVLAAALGYSPARDIVFRVAIGARELPARFMARLRNAPSPLSQPFGLDNFTMLETTSAEAVYGMAGRFWQSDYGQSPIADADAFCRFDQPGSARLALRFTATPLGAGLTQLSTETRIQCLGDDALRRFRWYWYLIRPVSGLIRQRMLATIRDDAVGKAF